MDDNDNRNSNPVRSRSLEPTSSSSRKSKRDAKGTGAYIADQLYKHIKVVATKQLGVQESTYITPTCAIM